MPATYFPFRWMVGTFQEILDSSSGNCVRMKSITDLRVFSLAASCEVKYSLTDLNIGEPFFLLLLFFFTSIPSGCFLARLVIIGLFGPTAQSVLLIKVTARQVG